MTRKDYVAIAEAIAILREQNDPHVSPSGRQYRLARQDGIDAAAIAVANVMAGDNPVFDRRRFLDACGVGS